MKDDDKIFNVVRYKLSKSTHFPFREAVHSKVQKSVWETIYPNHTETLQAIYYENAEHQ
jgi:hypothetical protein